MPAGNEGKLSDAPYRVNVELTGRQIEYFYEALESLYFHAEDTPEVEEVVEALEKIAEACDRAVEVRKNAPELTNAAHRWEGTLCDTNSCNHSSSFHSGGKGLCSAESCPCMKFTPSLRTL